MPVRRCRSRQFRSDIPAGSGAIINHHLLSPFLHQFQRKDAADNIGATAGRERHNEAHRPVGKGLSGCCKVDFRARKLIRDVFLDHLSA